jgi:hypothetical protein
MGYHRRVGLWSRLIRRQRGVLAVESEDEESKTVHLPPAPPTPSTKPIAPPAPTPGSRPLGGLPPTAGTRRYGSPGGTPSTQRIHNPSHPGR